MENKQLILAIDTYYLVNQTNFNNYVVQITNKKQ